MLVALTFFTSDATAQETRTFGQFVAIYGEPTTVTNNCQRPNSNGMWVTSDCPALHVGLPEGMLIRNAPGAARCWMSVTFGSPAVGTIEVHWHFLQCPEVEAMS